MSYCNRNFVIFLLKQTGYPYVFWSFINRQGVAVGLELAEFGSVVVGIQYEFLWCHDDFISNLEVALNEAGKSLDEWSKGLWSTGSEQVQSFHSGLYDILDSAVAAEKLAWLGKLTVLPRWAGVILA
ncbi:hypothetical protein GCK72_025291 [Caenorhabditis remanei]|uniref:Uncharacterized protein n=1 Tax=Caenorhabditis remanei TaxID=31234 RepID=A0A6A5G2I4_CAERE|nr:hypothetical protein GCK72_025291 [Caenorhabditis remanei]KAF1748824.1 hypothetical protein GCK72_025291 [Caenorhabditis remanei]